MDGRSGSADTVRRAVSIIAGGASIGTAARSPLHSQVATSSKVAWSPTASATSQPR